MRRFAEIDDNNIVLRIIVADSPEWVTDNLGGLWVETFADENDVVRAGIGYRYDSDRNAFIAPQPFPSWLFDEESLTWVAPVDMPSDGNLYFWDEEAGNWVEVSGA